MSQLTQIIPSGGSEAVMLIDRTMPETSSREYFFPKPLIGGVNPLAGTGVMPIRWGNDDRFPEHVNEIICSDPHALQVINRKVQFAMGEGIYLYKEEKQGSKRVKVEVIYPAIDDWLEENKEMLDPCLEGMFMNNELYGGLLVECIPNKLKNRILSVRNIDAHYYRALPIKKGKFLPTEFVIYNNKNPHTVITDDSTVKTFNKDYKTLNKFLIRRKGMLPGNPYYSIPAWYGGRDDMYLRMKILQAQIKGLESGWDIRFHLELHEKFYYDCKNEDEKRAKKLKLVNSLNNLLSRKNNINNALVTEMFSDHVRGNVWSGVKVTPINNQLVDSSITKLIELKQNAQPASFGLDPSLAGLDTGKTFTSSVELKSKYLIHQLLYVVSDRNKVLSLFDMIRTVHNWPKDIKFGFRNVELDIPDARTSDNRDTRNER